MAIRTKRTKRIIEIAARQREATPPADRSALLDLVARTTVARRKATGMIVGTLAGLGESGEPLVDFPSNAARHQLSARSLVPLDRALVGREVALLFEANDPEKPVVIGLIQAPQASPATPAEARGQTGPREVEIDGERLALTAEKEIVIRCGRATIVLTRAGKILIRGAYLLNRSSGVNRIKGGSVQIN